MAFPAGVGGTPPPTGLSITVLITAHHRAAFLRSAVESLLSQGAPSSSAQVIAVMDFEDPSLEDWLRGHSVEIVRTGDVPLSLMVAAGIGAASGEIIAFLDDDDRFSSQKLSILREEFAADPSLSYYHNGFRYVDSAGVEIPPELRNSVALRSATPQNKIRIGGPDKGPALRGLAHRHADFNNSSISISRELGQRALPYLHKIGFSIDSLFFYLALVNRGSLLIDGRVLTDYRLHGENLSTSVSEDVYAAIERKRRFGKLMHADYAIILEIARQSPEPEIRANAEAIVLMNRIYERLRDPVPHRLDMLRDLVRLPKYRETYVISSNSIVAMGSLLYPLLPRLTARIYRRRSIPPPIVG